MSLAQIVQNIANAFEALPPTDRVNWSGDYRDDVNETLKPGETRYQLRAVIAEAYTENSNENRSVMQVQIICAHSVAPNATYKVPIDSDYAPRVLDDSRALMAPAWWAAIDGVLHLREAEMAVEREGHAIIYDHTALIVVNE